MKKNSKIYLIIIIAILIILLILILNILFKDKNSGEDIFSYVKEKLTNQNNPDNLQETTNNEDIENINPIITEGGNSEDSSNTGTASNCVYNQISYSIGELNEFYFCNLEQENICVDKTAKCSVEVENFDETLGGNFEIFFTLSEKENKENIIQTQSVSKYIEFNSKQKLMMETTILGTEANKNLSCSYLSTKIPQQEICS